MAAIWASACTGDLLDVLTQTGVGRAAGELLELGAEARADVEQAAPDQGVVIAADKSARYEDVLSVLDVLQRNGVRKVGLLARGPQ